MNKYCNKLLLVTYPICFWLLILPLHGHCQLTGGELKIQLNKKYLRRGETVKIWIKARNDIVDIIGNITTPLGNNYPLNFVRSSDSFQAAFDKTTELGFLKKDWGKYHIKVTLKTLAQLDLILKEQFSILDSEKDLYMVLWVDDFGAYGELLPENHRWYHQNAGPISCALEWDDRGFFNLPKLLEKYDFSYDFLSHHFHAMHWSHPRLLLYFDYYLYKYYSIAKKLANHSLSELSVPLHIRDRYVFVTLVLIGFVALMYKPKRNRLKLLPSVLIIAGLTIFLLSLNNKFVSNPRNWNYELENPNWCKEFLSLTSNKLSQNGFNFPQVVRHGWNLPPADLMEFYMSELGVLADASAISGVGLEIDFLRKHGFSSRTITWKKDYLLPYYASLEKDYNHMWNGTEEDRGILELPLTYDNLSSIGFREEDKETIKQMPNGALISTYVHPQDDSTEVKRLVLYLKRDYPNTRFVRPDFYVDLYMSYFPRPISIDKHLTPYWGYVKDKIIYPITKTEVIDIVDKTNGSTGTYEFFVKTKGIVPLIQIEKPEGFRVLGEYFPVPTVARADKRFIILKNVTPGRNLLKFVKSD